MRLLVIFLCASTSAWAGTVAKPVAYPFISNFLGKVEIQARDTDSKKFNSLRVRKSLVLEGTVHINTPPGAQARIELDAQSSVTVLENSSVDFPAILSASDAGDSPGGEVAEIVLQRGSMRVDSSGNGERYYSTPVSRDAYSAADFLLSFDPIVARVSVTVFRGAIDFRGTNLEVSARVGAGERASFSGTIEQGKPAFDVLLQGRKVARGKLSPVDPVPASELSSLNQATLIKKPVQKKVTVISKALPGQICKQPFAKMDECVWRCLGQKTKKGTVCDNSKKGVTCVRSRCDADGDWVDELTLPEHQGRCEGGHDVVAPCDY